MTTLSSGIACRRDDDYALFDCFFCGLIDDAFRARNIFVSAQGNIQNPDVVALAVFDNPLNTAGNILFGNPACLADLHQHQLGFVCQATIQVITQPAITRGHNRGLGPVPLPALRRIGSEQARPLPGQILVNDDAIRRLC